MGSRMNSQTSRQSAPTLLVRGQLLELRGTLIMGIVNASPESFSDGNAKSSAGDHIGLAEDLIAAGADIIDIGGQSAVTNQPELSAADELGRVLPVVRHLTKHYPDALVSVDTYKPTVAAACLHAGAAIINDVSGLAYPGLVELCVQHQAALVIMHTKARPKQRLQAPDLYADVVGEVVDFLSAKAATAVAVGLPPESLILDPGPDFAKTPHQTISILRALDRVRALERPVLLALSRKDFLGAILGKKPRARDAGTLAAIAYLTASHPGTIVRVHDVRATRDVLQTVSALAGSIEIDPEYVLPDILRYEDSSFLECYRQGS